MAVGRIKHPEWAYDPNGELWWKAGTYAGSKLKKPRGVERRAAAYLAATKDVGDTFTTKEIRNELGTDHEHAQRRIRALRSPRDGWIIASYQDDSSLPDETYRVDKIGWHPALGPRPKNAQVVSAKTRRHVLERDYSRCRICGVAQGEPYPSEEGSCAVMTVGHIRPQHLGGTNDMDNLQTECARCNEAARADIRSTETHDVVWQSGKSLPLGDKNTLFAWVESGIRTRSKLDEVFDRYRSMSEAERILFRALLEKSVGRQPRSD